MFHNFIENVQCMLTNISSPLCCLVGFVISTTCWFLSMFLLFLVNLTINTQIAAMALFGDFPCPRRLSMKSPICFIFCNIFLSASCFLGFDPMIFAILYCHIRIWFLHNQRKANFLCQTNCCWFAPKIHKLVSWKN